MSARGQQSSDTVANGMPETAEGGEPVITCGSRVCRDWMEKVDPVTVQGAMLPYHPVPGNAGELTCHSVAKIRRARPELPLEKLIVRLSLVVLCLFRFA